MSESLPLALTVERQGARVVAAVSGEVDTATSAQLEAQLLEAVDGGERDLALDLSDVGFLDSSGLRCLLVVQQIVTGRGRAVTLVGSSARVDRLLEITGLQELFPLAPEETSVDG